MTVIPPPPAAMPEEERERLVARAQPVRLVSIDDVTVAQLIMLYLKLFVAAIPLAFILGIVWLVVYAVASAGPH